MSIYHTIPYFISTSDPYVQVAINGAVAWTTEFIKQTTEPVWDKNPPTHPTSPCWNEYFVINADNMYGMVWYI